MKALRVGLTGGIGAGKSLALSEFARRGAMTLDADAIARAQARPGGPAYRRVVRSFGRGVLSADGALDRRKISELVFADPAARRRLERLTHPLVRAELARRLRSGRPRSGKPLIVVAVPLLFEAGLEGIFDLTVTVEAPPSVRRRRVARRDALTAAQIGARMKAQLPSRAREARADIVLRNDAGRGRFLSTVRRYHEALALLSRGAQEAR